MSDNFPLQSATKGKGGRSNNYEPINEKDLDYKIPDYKGARVDRDDNNTAWDVGDNGYPDRVGTKIRSTDLSGQGGKPTGANFEDSIDTAFGKQATQQMNAGYPTMPQPFSGKGSVSNERGEAYDIDANYDLRSEKHQVYDPNYTSHGANVGTGPWAGKEDEPDYGIPKVGGKFAKKDRI